VHFDLGCRLRLSALDNEGHVIDFIALIKHLNSLSLGDLFSELAHRECIVLLALTSRVRVSPNRDVDISCFRVVVCHSAAYEVILVGTIPM